MGINLTNFLTSKSKNTRMMDFQDLDHIDGLSISALSADLYKTKRDDLVMFYFRDGANHASVYTKSKIISENIKWNLSQKAKKIYSLIVNTRNANAFTGKQGYESLAKIADLTSEQLSKKQVEDEDYPKKITSKEIIFGCTGTIGETFPCEKIIDQIPNLIKKINYTQNKFLWMKAALGIMTTDTKPKLAYEEFIFNNKIIRIAAIAKGSGMIAPNLATMLSFIFTDADIPSNLLKILLKKAVAHTFNAITVDSDQSTNDMVSIFSTRKIKIGHSRGITDPVIQKFETALKNVCLNLAKQIVVDGEGADKFISINVINAKSLTSAKKIAFSVASSPLVKIAVAGEDPNWGRVVMGIGKSGEKVDKDKISIKFGEFILAENGAPVENIELNKIREYMKWDSIFIEINLNSGSEFFECFTCDFTHDYIDINADYKNST